MSRSRSKGKKAVSETVRIIKLIDPLLQGLLFILFLYALDTSSPVSYRTVLLLIFSVQFLSCCFNFVIKASGQRTNQRIIYVLALMVYAYFFIHNGTNVSTVFVFVKPALERVYTANELIFLGVGVIISFWYNVICFLEIKYLQKKREAKTATSY